MAIFNFLSWTHALPLCCSLFLSSTLIAQAPQDALFLKRIHEYWKEGDFDMIKRQLHSYLYSHPASEVKDELHRLLGDLYLQEKNYSASLSQYGQVEKSSIREQIFYNELICNFELKLYQKFIETSKLAPSHSSLSKEQRHSIQYLLASSFYALALSETESKNRETLLKEALESYNACKGTAYESASLLPLAYVHKMLGNDHIACSCFLALAQSDNPQKEDFLFEAALLQTKFSKESACKTLQQIIHLKGNRSSDAAYNFLILLFEEKKYKDLVLQYENLHMLLDNSQLSLVEYALGKSLFQIKDYKTAPRFLIKSLHIFSLSPEEKREIFYLTLECAYKTKNLELYDTTYNQFQLVFPDDPIASQAMLIHAELLKQAGQKQAYDEELKKFATKYPSDPSLERVLFEIATGLYEKEQWHEASETISAFLSKYPKSPLLPTMWKLKLNCAVENAIHSSATTIGINKQNLAAVIKDILSLKDILSPKEKAQYHYELIKTLYDLEQYEQCSQAITSFLSLYPQTDYYKEVEWLQLGCLHTNLEFLPAFITKAEHFLSKYSNSAEAPSIHLQLYNAYLKLAATNEEENVEKAADHLFQFYTSKEKPVKKENLEWLANYYYQKSYIKHSNKQIYLERSILVLHNLIQDEIQNSCADTKAHVSSIELNLFKLSDLLTRSRQWQQKADLLENWFARKHTAGSFTSQLHEQLILELGKAYAILGAKDKALELYDILIRTQSSSSAISSAALLQKTKIQYSFFTERDKREENEAFLHVLNDLKDIELKKKLYSEPIHLEAALEYAYCKSELCKNEADRYIKLTQLLQLIKNNFSDEVKEASNMHLEKGKLFYNKENIHQLYMSFIDAELLRLQALAAPKNQAQTLLSEMEKKFVDLQNHPALPYELQQRIEHSKEEMQSKI